MIEIPNYVKNETKRTISKSLNKRSKDGLLAGCNICFLNSHDKPRITNINRIYDKHKTMRESLL